MCEKTHEAEARLALGADPQEALLPFFRTALQVRAVPMFKLVII